SLPQRPGEVLAVQRDEVDVPADGHRGAGTGWYDLPVPLGVGRVPSALRVSYANRIASRSISSTRDRLRHRGMRGGCITTSHSDPGVSSAGRSPIASMALFQSGSRSTSVIRSKMAWAGSSR